MRKEVPPDGDQMSPSNEIEKQSSRSVWMFPSLAKVGSPLPQYSAAAGYKVCSSPAQQNRRNDAEMETVPPTIISKSSVSRLNA